MGETEKSRISVARTLRKQMTPWEARAWLRLRQWRSEGLHFRRQVPFGSYIVDFACHRSNLVVELDGSGHAEPHQALIDQQRDAFLASCGYHVVRIWNASLDEDLNAALDGVYRQAMDRLAR